MTTKAEVGEARLRRKRKYGIEMFKEILSGSIAGSIKYSDVTSKLVLK